MRKQTKIAAIVSAAALLAIGASMTSFAATGWQEENGTWVYYDRNENMVTQDWAKSGDNWFYLGDNGEMVRDALIESGDNVYYVDANGAMVTNTWIRVDNTGDDSEGAPSGYWYYFQNNGKAYKAPNSGKTAFRTINGKSYAFDAEGKMLFGWINGEATREEGDAAYKTGIYYLGDSEDGARVAGTWSKLVITNDDAEEEDAWFYFEANGKKVAAKERTINGKRYRFNADGVMDSGWVDVVKATDSEKVITSYKNYSSAEDGARKTKGWFKVVPAKDVNPDANEDEAEKWFYADGKGNMYADTIKTINGKKYLFNEKGEMVTGLRNLQFTGNTLVSYAEVNDADKVAAATAFGTLLTGKSGLYYFSDNGDMQFGAQDVTIDGDNYTFNFITSGSRKGRAVNGKSGSAYYLNGKKVKASDDLTFEVYGLDANGNLVSRVEDSTRLVDSSWKKYKGIVKETRATVLDKDLQYTGSANSFVRVGAANKYVVINSLGTVITSGSRKDGNDVRLVVKKGALVGAYINE